MAKIVQFIETFERCGDGKEGNPFRLVRHLWSMDGNLEFKGSDEYEDTDDAIRMWKGRPKGDISAVLLKVMGDKGVLLLETELALSDNYEFKMTPLFYIKPKESS